VADEEAPHRPATTSCPPSPWEVGGGLSLGFAASLNQPISLLLFYLGGLLPLVACSLSIAAHRVSELLTCFAPRPRSRPTFPPCRSRTCQSRRAGRPGTNFRSQQKDEVEPLRVVGRPGLRHFKGPWPSTPGLALSGGSSLRFTRKRPPTSRAPFACREFSLVLFIRKAPPLHRISAAAR